MNLASLFIDAARAHPEREALVLSDHSLTYAELAARVQRLRAQLDPKRDGPHCGLLAHRSETAYAGVLAVLAAGCAYVPLHPAFPALRNREIVDKAGIRTLLVGPECVDALHALLATDDASYRIVTLAPHPAIAALVGEFPARLIYDRPPLQPSAAVQSATDAGDDAVAYVIFTSGSTGKPKGVVVRHRNVQRYVQNFLSLYPIDGSDRLSQTFALTFDPSVHDMFVAWASGATLVVYPTAELANPIDYTRRQRVSVWFSVPSVAALLESLRRVESGALPGLRLSLFAGEKLTWNAWRVWRTVAPNTRVVNLYGPTEATITITHFEAPSDYPATAAIGGGIPIGRALPGQCAEILRRDGTRCAAGELGALWLSGDQIAAGYLGEPALSAERFAAEGGRVRYRTGDLALCDAAGVMHFAGREDSQVKIMGYRVELGEIEHALMRVSGAAEVMADIAIRHGVEELFAVLPAALSDQKKRIREALAELLPSYMLPRRFLFATELPRNASGKLDRNAIRRDMSRDQPA